MAMVNVIDDYNRMMAMMRTMVKTKIIMMISGDDGG